MKIAVDAMGGDHAPVEIVKGAVEASVEYGIPVILVGDQGSIESELSKYSCATPNIEIRHASEIVHMDEHPANAIRRKPDSSIVVCANLVKSGEAQAMVSAGNTGAAMSVATLRLGRIRGIIRPAIGSLLPTLKSKCVMLDAGANVDCSVDNLLQFAIMGNAYAERLFKIEKPRVGLLSIGEEPSKGNELTKLTNARLSETALNFIGNVEGKEIFRGAADVVICDGFAGNIILKVAEGVSEFFLTNLKNKVNESIIYKIGALLMRPAFRDIKNRLDYAEYGGAPLLGVNGICIISHGRSNARAARNAIRAAADAVENDVVGCIAASVRMQETPLIESVD
ncbi:MAG: phosphate acyltransferase PlsX [Armatimonadota bacterium]